MMDFILAGLIYLGLMFVVFFCFSFVTIGLTYAVTAIVRRCISRFRQPHLAMRLGTMRPHSR